MVSTDSSPTSGLTSTSTSTPKVLVSIITGARPKLSHRMTRKLLPSLREYGFTDIEWVIREDQVDSYEADEVPFNVYPMEFANSYSKTHWRHPIAKWEAGGFHGAFTGREWAMRQGTERGYDLVLQLDDNVRKIGVLNVTSPRYTVTSAGEVLWLLARLAMATNVSMLGCQLNSVRIRQRTALIRPGFPYSVFVEKTADPRLGYYGPFEDDIMHAMDYGLHPSPQVTAGVVEVFRYAKNHTIKSGMRRNYNPTRGLGLVKHYPKNAVLREGAATSSPNDTSRGVRHFLNTDNFTSIRVTDRAAYEPAARRVAELVAESGNRFRDTSREVMRRRGGLSTDDASSSDAQEAAS